MKTNTQLHNWLLDAALFGAFLVAFLLDLTGLSLHQWLGVAVLVVAAYHLARHWSWVQAVSQRFFGRTSRQARLYYAVDAGLLAGFLLILFSGLVISTWLGLALDSYAAWVHLHVLASIFTLLLVVVKIGLHARWTLSVARRAFAPPLGAAIPASHPRPGQATAASERRAFLKLMGVVGIASLVALGSALGGLQDSQASASTSGSGESVQPQDSASTRASSSTTSSSSSGCAVRCSRGCSYPGHCRRYTDSNGNNLCDLGECV